MINPHLIALSLLYLTIIVCVCWWIIFLLERLEGRRKRPGWHRRANESEGAQADMSGYRIWKDNSRGWLKNGEVDEALTVRGIIAEAKSCGIEAEEAMTA